ncbi:MAG: hypothetical protein U0R71_10865 [Solirubrobacterales bacterium]
MAALGTFSPAQVDAAITTWGLAQSETMRREQRGKLSSELFDIRGRTWVGFECYYRAVPELLAALAERLPPEEIGRRMKRPGSRPYYLQLFILMSNYLCAREQRILTEEEPPEADPEQARELRALVEFFARAARAYREDGVEVPSAPAYDQRILDPEWAGRCAALLGPTDELARVRRALAGISLYVFLLHGEQRDGNFDHGPYELADGTRMLIHEINDLDNDYLPWADAENPPALSNVCIAQALRDVGTRFSIFAGCVTDPAEFADRVERFAVFTVEGEELRPLDPEELEAVAAEALALQAKLYQQIVEWEPIERVRYARWMYANHIVPFLRMAQAEDLVARLSERFEAIGQEAAEEYLSFAGPPAVLVSHTKLPEGSMFSPLAGVAQGSGKD